MDLVKSDFSGVTKMHDDNVGVLREMRRMATKNAEALATSFKTYPGTERFHAPAVQKIIASGSAITFQAMPVFDPWTNWWAGNWMNDPKQRYYHIWDKTFDDSGRALQLVSQSKDGFARSGDPDSLVSADLAINVCSSDYGITGWVSKSDMEMPHIGYRLNEQTLLWIARTGLNGTQHMMFFEWVDSSKARYGIHGRIFNAANGKVTFRKEKYFGHYAAQPKVRSD